MEQAGYFSVPGAHLYTVIHEVKEPVARVFLVGPFASERHNSYGPWTRWARYLAERRIEVVRHDYRGVGESTGVFEELSFENWHEDVLLLGKWLSHRTPSVPLILHGLEIGGLLVSKVFECGIGDILLLWSAPATANQALRTTLLRWVGLEQLLKSSDERKTGADRIRELEQGSSIEVEGYQWSPRLWQDSFELKLPSCLRNEEAASVEYKRPVRIVTLGADAGQLAKKGMVGGGDEIKDLSSLYSSAYSWINLHLGAPRGGGQ